MIGLSIAVGGEIFLFFFSVMSSAAWALVSSHGASFPFPSLAISIWYEVLLLRFGSRPILVVASATKECFTAFRLSSTPNPVDFMPFLRWVGMNGLQKRMQRLEKEIDGLLEEIVDEIRRKESEENPQVYTDNITKGTLERSRGVGKPYEVHAGAVPDRGRRRIQVHSHQSWKEAVPGASPGRKETMGLALASLVQCFEWRRLGEEEVDLAESEGLTTPMAVPLEALCKPRQAMRDVLSPL
ncbi:hypothetical protein GW17_00032722 [Ensete ventricosum]|nr:hypothetical protein GW17_00032722 [Ensete ventricosum]